VVVLVMVNNLAVLVEQVVEVMDFTQEVQVHPLLQILVAVVAVLVDQVDQD
tara:strand:+ start:311 stop:463 length:153 start_codon:yes stop_codon:yes gene_type:complete